jgi:hypothetical protein
MKVIIAGSRTFTDYSLLVSKCDEILKDYTDITIVSGNARGTDKLGEKYGYSKDYNVKIFPANWQLYGKSAGMIRNKEMADYGNMLIAFWDGVSNGTRNMINLAKTKGLITHIINY